MDAQLLTWTLSTEGLYNDYLPQIKDSIRLTSLERQKIDRTEKFRQENNRQPSREELQLWYPEIPSENGLPEKAIRDELTRLITEKKVKSLIIKTAGDIDRHGVDKTKLFSEFDKLKAELNFKEEPQLEPAIPVNKFVKLPIPPVEYYANPLLQKQGRLIVSASYGTCKTNFVLNLGIALTTGKTEFLDKIPIEEQARVLHLDGGEMGKSPLKNRFILMGGSEILKINSLFVKCLPPIDLLQSEWQRWLEEQISKLKIEVLIFDPLSAFWTLDENSKQDVSFLTAYLDSLIYKFGISVIAVLHWKKPTREFRTGGVMASGSHKWMGWTDCHVTLEGSDTNSIIISCDKSRNSPKFAPFIVRLNPDTLWLEWVADYTKKFTEQTLLELFDKADTGKTGKVRLSDLRKVAGDKPSRATIDRLIKESNLFKIEKHGQGKESYLIKKDLLIAQKGDEQVAEIEDASASG